MQIHQKRTGVAVAAGKTHGTVCEEDKIAVACFRLAITVTRDASETTLLGLPRGTTVSPEL